MKGGTDLRKFIDLMKARNYNFSSVEWTVAWDQRKSFDLIKTRNCYLNYHNMKLIHEGSRKNEGKRQGHLEIHVC